MIEVGDIVVDPDFAQAFTVLRSAAGDFTNGVWKEQKTELQLTGTICVASAREIEMRGEGDVIRGAITIYTIDPLLTTAEGKGSSDIVIWQGDRYRVMQIEPFSDYGYYRAFATRMSTAA